MSWNTIHTFSVGEVATAANVNNNDSNLAYIPHEWDYAQITANPSGITATTEGTAVAVITGNSVTYDGGRVKVEVFFPDSSNTGSAAAIFVVLRDSTVVGHIQSQSNSSGNNLGACGGFVFDTPAAGAHTYSVSAYVSTASTHTLKAGAGGSGNLVPAFLRVTAAKSHP